ncbi:hypothetical protein FisN_31Lu093 [Fistulifera solaris]|uniref:Uncharacterized protein n=1 Tax=Fistulifera solaris TaxID=1519565 RepID=A0A1Z5K799_FISSO|nr:hypothetical protein FisN_31Lu093 [Fistulifera solaris]|eukprot:GAX21798.1 hypothetical protein FisN_31Lu093 [Fistulifera solaris]
MVFSLLHLPLQLCQTLLNPPHSVYFVLWWLLQPLYFPLFKTSYHGVPLSTRANRPSITFFLKANEEES